MRYLLETDHISFYQREAGPESEALYARMAQHSEDDFAFSIVSFHEQVMGAHAYINRARSASDVIRGYQLLGQVISDFERAAVLLFDSAAAREFDALSSGRLRVATMDLRIASIALARGLILLTRNSRDFAKIPELVIEDWTA